jgi:hypothetical protein
VSGGVLVHSGLMGIAHELPRNAIPACRNKLMVYGASLQRGTDIPHRLEHSNLGRVHAL